jgi:hypothetical protein
MVPQAIVDFGSQVNILLKETWINMGRPRLTKSTNFLKLADQRFVEPIEILRNAETIIMGILTLVDFEVINLVEGILAYTTLVGQPWGEI